MHTFAAHDLILLDILGTKIGAHSAWRKDHSRVYVHDWVALLPQHPVTIVLYPFSEASRSAEEGMI